MVRVGSTSSRVCASASGPARRGRPAHDAGQAIDLPSMRTSADRLLGLPVQ